MITPQKAVQALTTHIGKGESNPSAPRWKHRRRLVYVGFFLGVFMILFGMATFWWDRQVSAESIISGTAIITILMTAYVGGATYDDTRLLREPLHEEFTENPE